MRLAAGGVRELHWHKEAEWSFMLAGNARITAVDTDGHNFVADVGPLVQAHLNLDNQFVAGLRKMKQPVV